MPPNANTDPTPADAETAPPPRHADAGHGLLPPTGKDIVPHYRFVWQFGLGAGAAMVVVFLLPLGGLSLYGVPFFAALAGVLAGMRSYRLQAEPYFMPTLRHGAWAGLLAILPLVVALLTLTNADIFELGGVPEEDAVFGPATVALGMCCAGGPFAMVLGALGGLLGYSLASMRANPLDFGTE
jgi:hypothetical protein